MTSGRPTLWRHRDFLKLWAGQSVSRLGSQVSLLALPLIAITVLKATTFEVGLLSAVEFAPFLLVGLPAGVVVDRLAKRPVLIAADVGRLVAIGSVPLAYEPEVYAGGRWVLFTDGSIRQLTTEEIRRTLAGGKP